MKFDFPAKVTGGRWRAAGITFLAVTALVGAGLVGTGLNVTPPRPPQPAIDAGPSVKQLSELDKLDPDLGAGTKSPSQQPPDPVEVGLGRSEPTTIEIEAIGVSAKLLSLGLNSDGTIQVPPLKEAQLAGWYNRGPTPGEVGNSVIVGHVDSAEIGPAVFFQLGALKPNDTIRITRRDKTTATFTVTHVASYPKTAFPTEIVYGPNSKPALRVVTCGGTFDEKRHTYPNNIIAFATLTTVTTD